MYQDHKGLNPIANLNYSNCKDGDCAGHVHRMQGKRMHSLLEVRSNGKQPFQGLRKETRGYQ